MKLTGKTSVSDRPRHPVLQIFWGVVTGTNIDFIELIWEEFVQAIKWFCKQIGKSKLRKADLEGPAFKLVRPFHANNISLQFQMEECHLLLTDQIDLVNPEGHRVMPDVSKPLPLGGPPCQVTIQPQYFFNKDLEYLISGDKDKRNALSISKLKAAYYPDFGLEELVPSLWIESVSLYFIKSNKNAIGSYKVKLGHVK
ncbi:hypothetical protein Tco_0057381 [Tanacetum coccineum]